MFSLHTNHTRTQQPHTDKLAEVSSSNGESGGKVGVFKVEVQTRLEVKGKNVHVNCTFCPRAKCLSISIVSNSNLMKHLSTAQTSTKLVTKNTIVDTVDDDSRPVWLT